MDEQRTVKIIITGKMSYEDSITLSQAAQIVAFIDSSSGLVPTPASPAQVRRLGPAVNDLEQVVVVGQTPVEALESSNAKTNPEKIVAFAGLVVGDGQKDTFTIEDIKPLFRRARHATPKNLSRDLAAAIRSGWIDDAEVKGEYYLTKKAFDAIEKGFSADRSAKPASATRVKVGAARKSRRSVEVPDAFKDVDPIPHTLEGLVDYHVLSQRKDQFLWVLKLAKELGLDGLSNKEIAWLTDRLGAGIPGNNIASAFGVAQKSGHVNKSTQTNNIRITRQGEEYLRTVTAEKG